MEASARTGGRDEIAREMLTQTCSDLDAARNRHQKRAEMHAARSAASGADALARLLEHRRERGADPTAFEPHGAT